MQDQTPEETDETGRGGGEEDITQSDGDDDSEGGGGGDGDDDTMCSEDEDEDEEQNPFQQDHVDVTNVLHLLNRTVTPPLSPQS